MVPAYCAETWWRSSRHSSWREQQGQRQGGREGQVPGTTTERKGWEEGDGGDHKSKELTEKSLK